MKTKNITIKLSMHALRARLDRQKAGDHLLKR